MHFASIFFVNIATFSVYFLVYYTGVGASLSSLPIELAVKMEACRYALPWCIG